MLGWGSATRSRAAKSGIWGSLFAAAAGMCYVFAPCSVARAQDAPASTVSADSVTNEINGNLETNGIDSTSYDRGRNVSVEERPRPDYDALGIDVPGFVIYPKMDLGLSYDSNIYALQNNTIGDEIFTVTPEVDFASTWSRDSLSGYAKVAQDVYFDHSAEDATAFDTGLVGKLDLGESTLTGGGEFGRFILPRWSSNNFGIPVHRIPYYYGAANAELAHEFARVRLSARADFQNYQYENGHTSTGALVFDQDQNHYVVTGTGKAEFALTPDAALYVTADGNTRQYNLQPPVVPFTRNSSGYEVDAGANFDITHLVRGEFQIGYLNQNYVSPIFKPIQGLGGKAKIEWFPTQLITVTFQGTRAVGDAQVPDSAGYLASRAQGQADYEFRRNIILSANLWAEQDKYDGIDRTDNLVGAGASARWLLNRHLGLNLAYTYADQSSTGTAAGPIFDDNRVSVSATVQY